MAQLRDMCKYHIHWHWRCDDNVCCGRSVSEARGAEGATPVHTSRLNSPDEGMLFQHNCSMDSQACVFCSILCANDMFALLEAMTVLLSLTKSKTLLLGAKSEMCMQDITPEQTGHQQR